MSHPLSAGSTSYIHPNESLPSSPTRRNFGPYGQMRSLVPMRSFASLPPACSSKQADDEDRKSVETTPHRITLWGSEYDLGDSSRSKVSKTAAWGQALNNRIGKAFRNVKRHFTGARASHV